jgi:hypothetical protein
MFRRYPLLSLIVLSYAATVGLFIALGPAFFSEFAEPYGVVGIFVSGFLFTWSFTTSIATILLPTFAAEHSILFIAVIGGIGAAFADVTIFRFVRGGLRKEIQTIGRMRVFRKIGSLFLFRNSVSRAIIGFLVLASPLPDEFGVLLMARSKIKEENFAMLGFAANAFGIYVLVSSLAFLY